MNKNDSFKECITRDYTQPVNLESLLFGLSWKVLQLLLKEEGSSDSSQKGYACMYHQTLWWRERVTSTKHTCHIKQTQLACGLRSLSGHILPVFRLGKKGETMFWTAPVCHICLQNVLIGCAFRTRKHARLNMAVNKKTQSNSLVFPFLTGHTQKDLGRWSF